MGNIGDPITQTIPAVGTSGTTYATDINLFLTEVKTRLESLVPRASLVDADLDMVGYGLQTAGYVELYPLSSAPTTPVSATNPTNSIIAYAGDLYWQNLSGAVKITDGTTLNTALMGGITGDYGGANPAQFRFVDADQEYYAYDDHGTGAWARVWARNFDIAAGATSAVRARLAFGGAGSVTYTLPTAAPTSSANAIVQMDTAGQLTVSNTLGVSITATDFKYSTARSKSINAGLYGKEIGTSTHVQAGDRWTLQNSTGTIYIPITLESGEVLSSWVAWINKVSAGTVTLRARLFKTSQTTGSSSQVGSTQTTSAVSPGYTFLTDTGLSETAGLGYYYYLIFDKTAGDPTGDQILNLGIVYTRP